MLQIEFWESLICFELCLMMMVSHGWEQLYWTNTYIQKMMKLKLIQSLLLLMLCKLTTASVSFTVAASSVAPDTARSPSSLYSMTLNAISVTTLNFDIYVTFPSDFKLTSVSGCQLLINSNTVPSAQCAISSNIITFTQLNNVQTISTLSLLFYTGTALYSGSFTISINYYLPNTTTLQGSNSARLLINSAPMTCSLVSTSNIVGATANYSFTLIPPSEISSDSTLQIVFPAWSVYSLTNFPGGTNATICGNQCEIKAPNKAQGYNSQQLTYKTLFPINTSSSKVLTMVNARNPSSTQPITVIATLYYNISNAYFNCSATFAPSVSNSFQSVTFEPSNLSISAVNPIILVVNLTNPISSISYFGANYGADLSLSFLLYADFSINSPVTASTSLVNTLLLGNLTSSTSYQTRLTLANYTLTNAPYANYPVPITFFTQNLVSSNYYAIDTITISLTFTTSPITIGSLSILNSAINTVTAYTLSFTSVNTLIAGSLILITIPTETFLQVSSSCTCSIASKCVVYNTTSLLITINSIVVVASTNITTTINNILNPVTTTPSSSFAISTFYYNFSTPVDILSAPIKVTATKVTLSGVNFSSTSVVVAATSTFTITLQIKNALPANSYIIITFPATSFLNSASPVLSLFLIAGTAASGLCSMSVPSTLSFKFSSCISSALTANTIITIKIGNMINPLSTKTTDSLSVSTFYNNLEMEYMNSGITLTLTTPTTLSNLTANPVSHIVNDITTYSFAIGLSQQHYSGDRFIITFPTTLKINSGFQCSSSTSGITVSCIKSSAQVLTVTITALTVPSNLNLSITNIQNNWYVSSSSITMQTTTNDTTYYYVEESSATVTLDHATITSSYTPTNSLVLLSTSTLQISISNPFIVTATNPSLLSLVIVPPADLTIITSTACTTSLTGTTCTPSASVITVTQLTSFSNTISVTFSATASYFITSSSFSINLSYNGSAVSSDNTLTATRYCLSPCKGCTINNTQCTSCLPIPYTTNNYLFNPNASCLTTCPDHYYLPTGTFTCSSCNSSSCLNCQATPNTCTSCQNTKFLYNATCLLACPNTYFGSASICVSCLNQCYNCTSATYCLTCITGYALNPNNTCLLTCPSTHTVVAGICQLCASTCLTCLGTINTCTSCLSSLILNSNSCISSCPLGQFNNSNSQCQACISPCKYCLDGTHCTSCLTGFYTYNVSQCVSICPAGTYLSASACFACTPPCQTCNNIASNCSSCNSSFYHYLNTCYTQCPTPTYPYQGICTTCVSPCNTCLNGAFSCSSCIANYYLLNASCVQNCPTVKYLTVNGSCIQCPANCLVCVSSISCSLCQSGYLQFQGGCLSNCPLTSPIIINQTCTGCNPQCSTCDGAPDRCITCTIYYFKYTYTCLQSCPLTFYSNQLTFTCQSGLSSKIVFFPVLITFLVIFGVLLGIKCFTKQTSFATALTAFSSLLQIAIWIFLLSLLFQTYLEPDINYNFPRVLIVIALLTTLIGNILYFCFNFRRLSQDDYVRKWQTINVNFTYLQVFRWVSLFTCHKIFRLIYSKLFNSIHLSLVARHHKNVFFTSTMFSLFSLIFSQIPMIIASFYLAYSKMLKDQVFYTSCECLVITLAATVIALIDIYKPLDYFEDTQFMQTKRYLQKVNNDSCNKLQDQFREKDQGSIDGEKFIGTSGGKFIITKNDLASNNQLLFEEQSIATDGRNRMMRKSIKTEEIGVSADESQIAQQISTIELVNSPKSSRSMKKKQKKMINIFQPIQEEQGEYYQILKYDQQDFKTMARIQEQNIQGNESQQQNQLQIDRKQQFGMTEQTCQEIDDNRSMMQYRQRRQKWNSIIEHRQKIAQQIFNTVDTKELAKQLQKIEQPIDQEDDRDQQLISQKMMSPLRQKQMKKREKKLFEQNQNLQQYSNQKQEYNQENTMKKNRRKKRRNRTGNKQLQQIYLQRLAEKVLDSKKKPIYASSKNFKYQF